VSHVAKIESHAVRAWPSTHAEQAGGWLLRHTPGVGKRRNNSALPSPGVTDGIETAEEFYRKRDMPVIVQVSPAEEHSALDGTLAARGYRHDAPTLVLAAAPGDVMRPAPGVDIGTELTPAWRSAYGNDAVSEHVLDRITLTTGFASIVVDSRVAALGLFVVGDGVAGVFCMATEPRHRRRGLAEAILRAGASWSAGRGADLLYLQVEEENEVARTLYAKAGFEHSHSYHYRVLR
jgi:GNAT superfamily N-acetyltransferase